ncbi:hypothetical protein N7457_009048 [Penicillium paradoxum]|uniref:uncharacterized protein n=1 Tax=Penicillium paradoxum TaxID=176176 RepID=UPI0025470138|nr:uncharacterized protein N7457_009048 [Penicillium paradoxum]KAJ5774152.1 hypothetical protein N7457_009048 [Penicillium paradoxum]
MPRPELARDPYNDQRIHVLQCIHDAIYYLRHGPHRRNDVLDTLAEVAGMTALSISSAVLEGDPQFERLCRNLELILPVSIRILNKHNDRQTDREVGDDLISCIPTVLQQPDQWNPEVEEISDEEEFVRQERQDRERQNRSRHRHHRNHHNHHHHH